MTNSNREKPSRRWRGGGKPKSLPINVDDRCVLGVGREVGERVLVGFGGSSSAGGNAVDAADAEAGNGLNGPHEGELGYAA